MSSLEDTQAAAQRAYQASSVLARKRGSERAKALQAMAKALASASDEILEANTLDLEASIEMAVPNLILDWLKLTPERLQSTVQLLSKLAELPDPIRRLMNAPYQVEHSQTYSQLMPLGTIALIYEAFPELAAIAAGLCIKTGNCLILRGSSEASHSNAAIADILQGALAQAEMPSGCLEILAPDAGASIRDLVCQDHYINLVIPYGRPSLVQQVVRQSTAPVLRSAMGNCYLYWSPTGSLDLVRWAITDSHQSEPDPVNAIEKVLIHHNQKLSSLALLCNTLQDNGFDIRLEPSMLPDFSDLKPAADSEWNQPYLTKTVAFKMVDSIEEAISWINQHSSGHADCIVTESYQESCQFAAGINSASAYINASPRFYRHSRQGDAVFLGMSNQKGHRRGSIGLETLTTIKQIVQGYGQF
ncbi:MAG: glutamate-5-semialdehyde dehydrogenase [Oscillatoriaceae cyanobacterium]